MAVAEAEEWDAHRAVRDLIQKTPELRDIYGRLGYSPYVEEGCRKLLAELNGFEVAIPDFAQFQASLDSVIAAIERHERGEEEVDPLFFADRELFDSVVNARANPDAVHELLNADFRKRLPICLEVAAIARRPRNPDAFSGALRELEQLLGKRWIPQTQEVRDELLEAASELREELDRGDGSLVTSLESLEGKVEDAVFNIADEHQDERKRSLDEVLWSFVYARHEYQPHEHHFIEGVAEEAKTYIDSTWMHTRWLSSFILRHLLDGEVARKVPAGVSQRGLLVSAVGIGLLYYLNLGVFALLWLAAFLYYVGVTIWHTHKTKPLVVCQHEILAGNYDDAEVARRLRALERRGVFVHSLILRLLELDPLRRECATGKIGNRINRHHG
jgi:hypothetical protein